MLGPAYTLTSTGNVAQAGFSYGSSELITMYTGKTPIEHVLSEKQIKTLDKTKSKINLCTKNPDFCKAINLRIEKTRKQLLGLNLQARIEKNHQKILENQKKD